MERFTLIYAVLLLFVLHTGRAETTGECKDPSQCPPTTTSSPSDAAIDDPARQNVLPILQQAMQFLPPELQDAVKRMEPLDDDEVHLLVKFVQDVQAALGTLPQATRAGAIDLLEAIEDTGILDNLNVTLQGISQSYPPDDLPESYTESWPRCQADLLTMLMSYNSTDMWALTMIDAMGKIGRSITKGNLNWIGNNDQCTSVHYQNGKTLSDFRGKICRAAVTLDLKAMGLDQLASLSRPLVWDACLPDSCDSGDLNRAMYTELEISNIHWQCTADLDMSSDVAAIIALVILGLFAALLFAGSLAEICLSFDSKEPSGTNSKSHNIKDHSPSSMSFNGSLNKGFDLGEKDVIKVSTTETSVDVTLPTVSPTIDNGGVYKRINGIGPDTPMQETAQRQLNNASEDRLGKEGNQTQHQDQRNTEKRRQEPALPRWQRALLSFSIQRNTGKIFSVDTSPGTIGCLHGIRVLSLAWVILGHLIIFGASFGTFQNAADIWSRINTMPFQIILNAPLSVDTFYFMSGFLTCYLFLKECAKSQKVTIKQMILYYVHRYWRLTPPLMMWVMVEAVVVQYVGEGRAGWTDYVYAPPCRTNWWTNLLYINSVYDNGGMCVGVSWFLANDMMYYIIAPLVLVPWVYRQRVVGFAMATVLIGVHVSSNVWLITEYNFDMLRQSEKYTDKLYFKPYTRVAPFAIGLIFGYIMHKAKGKLTMNKWVVFLGWLLALGTIFTLTLVTYDENGDPEYAVHGWSAGGKAAYETIARPMWAVAIGWMVVACASGYGGIINSVLSWPGWQPLSRLTYSAYLVHMCIIAFEMTSPIDTYLFTDIGLVYLFAGYYLMSYAVGYVLCIAVESPMLGLEKAALK